jgi:hypothetical protein
VRCASPRPYVTYATQFQRHIPSDMVCSGCPPVALLGAFSTSTRFRHPIERWLFCLSCWDQEGAFARAVMRAVPKMRLIGRVFNGPSGRRAPRLSAHGPSCVPWIPRYQFDLVNQDRRRRRETDGADRSDRSLQMHGPEILYLLRVTIESQSLGRAVAISADPRVPCDDVAPGGECA